jgi:hypothetical protein
MRRKKSHWGSVATIGAVVGLISIGSWIYADRAFGDMRPVPPGPPVPPPDPSRYPDTSDYRRWVNNSGGVLGRDYAGVPKSAWDPPEAFGVTLLSRGPQNQIVTWFNLIDGSEYTG